MNIATVHPHRNLYLKEIEEAFEVLEGLKKKGFYDVPKITWWILKYEELYHYSYNQRHVNSCYEGMGCCCTNKSPEMRFSSLYTSLEKIVDLYSHERYFEGEIKAFEQLNDNHQSLMRWLKKNEYLGSEEFLLFWLEWLDEKKEVVNPYIMNWQDEFIFKAEDWKNTISFCKAFNSIYWTSDICA
ncbi:hypothetical protein [Christiangramia crocea]|uniref:Uncharacterized protein n=1 Tax=Christiangramia crocea TaxID=2904124 RepID=A0A9X1UX64_9FLAO|nr:hypothetical protein [Gramella crocea]MCG9971149.1 hypothetical protein [Gramella crocea]